MGVDLCYNRSWLRYFEFEASSSKLKPSSDISGFLDIFPPAVESMCFLFDIGRNIRGAYTRVVQSTVKDRVAGWLIEIVEGINTQTPALRSLTLSMPEGTVWGAVQSTRGIDHIEQSCKKSGVKWTLEEEVDDDEDSQEELL